MPAQTGRTIDRYATVLLDDTGGTLREILVKKIGDVGLKNGKVDQTALQDLVKGVLLDTPEFTTSFETPFDTTMLGYLVAVNGLNTPLSFDVRFGIRQAYVATEPHFGIQSTPATNGVLVSDVTSDGNTIKWTVSMAAGSAAPAWNGAAIT